MYLLIALFLFFQTNDIYALDSSRPLDTEQIIADAEKIEDDTAEEVNSALGKTTDIILRKKIYLAFEDFIRFMDDIIAKIKHSTN